MCIRDREDHISCAIHTHISVFRSYSSIFFWAQYLDLIPASLWRCMAKHGCTSVDVPTIARAKCPSVECRLEYKYASWQHASRCKCRCFFMYLVKTNNWKLQLETLEEHAAEIRFVRSTFGVRASKTPETGTYIENANNITVAVEWDMILFSSAVFPRIKGNV